MTIFVKFTASKFKSKLTNSRQIPQANSKADSQIFVEFIASEFKKLNFNK